MNTTDLPGATWRKSSHSNGQAACVEVAFLDDGKVAVRGSKDKGAGPVLVFTAAIASNQAEIARPSLLEK